MAQHKQKAGLSLPGNLDSSMEKRLRIVVADDEPDMRRYFLKILPRLGFDVVAAAENGQRLVELCRDHRPDLVITDERMPILNGLEAVRTLQRERPVPVILVSALEENSLRVRADSDQVMCHLVKPVRQADLGPAIKLALERFQRSSCA
jgi:two-component system, response regulator PdtaR